MKLLIIVGCLLLATGATAGDLAKFFEHELEAVFARSPVVVEGWIKRTDGERGLTEVRWSTQEKLSVQKLRDFIVKMKLANYVSPSPGGASSAMYLRFSSATGQGKDENYIYVGFSWAATKSVSASHDPGEGYFDKLSRLVFAMYAQEAKIKVIQ